MKKIKCKNNRTIYFLIRSLSILVLFGLVEDCELDEWSEWGSCSTGCCKEGIQKRYRYVFKRPSLGVVSNNGNENMDVL